MQKIYVFDSTRNKLPLNKSPNKLKKDLFIQSKCCYICGKEFDLKRFQLEHKIPVIIGGHLFNLNNLGLVCIKCHSEKTKIDIEVIGLLRKLKLFNGRGPNSKSLVTLKELHNYYNYFYNLIKLMKVKYDNWFNGRVNKNYVQIFVKENRR